METGKLGIPYYVEPKSFGNHPVIGPELAREGVKVGKVVEEPLTASEIEKLTDKAAKRTKTVVRGKGKKRGPALRNFEDTVEKVYTQDLYTQCRHGVDQKERKIEAERGIFGIGTDWDKVERIKQEKIPSCEELRRLGLLGR